MARSQQASGQAVRAVGPSFAQHRLRELAAVSRPIGIAGFVVGMAAALKSLRPVGDVDEAREVLLEMAIVSVFPITCLLPALLVHTRQLWLLQPAVCASHVLRSALFLSMALRLAPLAQASRTMLAARFELLAEILPGLQEQLSPWVMAALHALRQAAYMAILVNRMGMAVHWAVLRGVLNWLVMLTVSCAFEMRNWASFCKRRREEQAAALALPGAEGQQLPASSKQWDAGEEQAAARDHGEAPGAKGAAECSAHVEPAGEPASAPSLIGGDASAGDASAGQASVRAGPQDSAQQAPGPRLQVQPPLPGRSAPLPYRRTRAEMWQQRVVTVKMDGVHLGDMPADLPMQLHRELAAMWPPMALAGLAIRQGCVLLTLDLACSRGHGMGERQDPCALAQRLAQVMSSVAHGCEALNAPLRQGNHMTVQVDGSVVSCSWDAPGQAYHALQCLSGAGTTCPLASSPQPNTAREKPLLLHHLGKLHAVARQCALRDVATPLPPLVATPDSRGGSEVEVSVVLQLPASGMRLVGCEASPTATQRNGGDAASIVAQPAQAEVALLVRRQAGPYLPVRVVACAGDAELGAGVGGGAEASVLVHATVVVQLDVGSSSPRRQQPAPLRLELWCRSPQASPPPPSSALGEGGATQGAEHSPAAAARLELLVADCPLLALPGDASVAAGELAAHLGHQGGVRPRRVCVAAFPGGAEEGSATSLLEDLNALLSLPRQLATTLPASAGPPQQQQQQHEGALQHAGDVLGAGVHLLLHAVGHAMPALASEVVEALERAERAEERARATLGADSTLLPAVGGSRWWARAAGGEEDGGLDDGPFASLLHAAFASGQPDVLVTVLRWAKVHGPSGFLWPWSLEDACGFTPLHFAAAHPPATCAALLDAVTATLPAAQAARAQEAWISAQGGVGASPAQAHAAAAHSQREEASSACGGAGTPRVQETGAGGSGASCRCGARCSPPQPSTAREVGTADADGAGEPCMRLGVWQWARQEVAEALSKWRDPEFCTWARQQMSRVVAAWSVIMLCTGVSVAVHSNSVAVMCLIHCGYVPTALSALTGSRWLGDWQAWMVVNHVLRLLGFVLTLGGYAPVPANLDRMIRQKVDLVYEVVQIGICDQTPLLPLVLVRLAQALVLHRVHSRSGIPRSLPQLLLMHTVAVLVTGAQRLWQVRAFRAAKEKRECARRWEQRAKPAPSAAAAADGGGGPAGSSAVGLEGGLGQRGMQVVARRSTAGLE